MILEGKRVILRATASTLDISEGLAHSVVRDILVFHEVPNDLSYTNIVFNIVHYHELSIDSVYIKFVGYYILTDFLECCIQVQYTCKYRLTIQVLAEDVPLF
jgi:hypothetical protein